MTMDGKVSAHYISGTHWDREWYRPFEEYRLLLVQLVDTLLEIMEADGEFRYFQFDGQTCMLEDYLDIRPENRERLIGVLGTRLRQEFIYRVDIDVGPVKAVFPTGVGLTVDQLHTKRQVGTKRERGKISPLASDH